MFICYERIAHLSVSRALSALTRWAGPAAVSLSRPSVDRSPLALSRVRSAPYLENRDGDGDDGGACGLWPGPGPSPWIAGLLTVWWCWGQCQDLLGHSQREEKGHYY